MSPTLPDEGLFRAIEELLDRFGQTHGICTHFVDNREDQDRMLSPAVEAQTLRIVQEALSNVRKHAGAQNVMISVKDTEGKILLVVRDDGRGFDPGDVNKAESFGLRIMSERAAEFGGAVEVVSSLGQGTEVRIEIPYSPADSLSDAETDQAVFGMPESSGRMSVLLVDDPLFLNALQSC